MEESKYCPKTWTTKHNNQLCPTRQPHLKVFITVMAKVVNFLFNSLGASFIFFQPAMFLRCKRKMESITLSFYKSHMHFIEKQKNKKHIWPEKLSFFIKSFQIPPKITLVEKHAPNLNTIHWRNHSTLKQMLGLKLHAQQKLWLAKLLLPKYH